MGAGDGAGSQQPWGEDLGVLAHSSATLTPPHPGVCTAMLKRAGHPGLADPSLGSPSWESHKLRCQWSLLCWEEEDRCRQQKRQGRQGRASPSAP